MLAIAIWDLNTVYSVERFIDFFCFYDYLPRTSDNTIWRRLIGQATTKYVYIGRNVAHFTKYDRLERLVREINNLEAFAVGSAIRGYHSGHVSFWMQAFCTK